MEPRLSISAVERDTGLSKDTLRMWERRYAFPRPLRDDNGERVYPAAQVDKLRLIKRLMDRGHRPGGIILRSLDELAAMASQAVDGTDRSRLKCYLQSIKGHDIAHLRSQLNQGLMREGLQQFIVETVAPLNAAVGDAWMRGELAVFEEHAYSEQMQYVLRGAISALQSQARPPRVLLTTLPGEQHGLGLLMVEALLAGEGTWCLSLGTETPVTEIARAAIAHRADVVALSFSASCSEKLMLSGLAQLRAELNPRVSLWAGGSATERVRKPIDGVELAVRVERVTQLLEQWRALQPSLSYRGAEW